MYVEEGELRIGEARWINLRVSRESPFRLDGSALQDSSYPGASIQLVEF